MRLVWKRSSLHIIVFCCIFAISGCALSRKIEQIRLKHEQRAAALREFDNRFKSLRTIGMVTADVFVNELLAGGEEEQNDEWSSVARKNITDVVAQEFTKRAFTVKAVRFDKETGKEPREAYYLYRALNENFREENDDYKRLSLCNDDFPCPDYTVGQVEEFFNKEKVDLLLFVFADDKIETAARKEARSQSQAAAAFSHIFGRGGIHSLRKPGAFVSMTMIDKGGAVFWHGSDDDSVVDLRNPRAADEMAKKVLEKLFRSE